MRRKRVTGRDALHWVGKHIPGLPTDRAQVQVRSVVAVVMFVTYLMAFHIRPTMKMLDLQIVWFQLCGGALLWWESNAEREIDAVVNELSSYAREPVSKMEQLVEKVHQLLPWMIYSSILLFAFVLVNLSIDRMGVHEFIGKPLLVALALVGFAGACLLLDLLLARQQRKLASKLRSPECANMADKRRVTRQALRTIGFGFIAVAYVVQFCLLLFR